MKEFEWFEWFEWFGPSPIEPFNPGGDGYVVAPEYIAKGITSEYCDDGNTKSGDGCSATCEKEEFS